MTSSRCTEDMTHQKKFCSFILSPKRLDAAGVDQLLRTPIFTFKQGL